MTSLRRTPKWIRIPRVGASRSQSTEMDDVTGPQKITLELSNLFWTAIVRNANHVPSDRSISELFGLECNLRTHYRQAIFLEL